MSGNDGAREEFGCSGNLRCTQAVMTTNNRFKNAIASSVELEERGEHAAAMGLLDQVIAEAIKHGEIRWIRTLCVCAKSLSPIPNNLSTSSQCMEQDIGSSAKATIRI